MASQPAPDDSQDSPESVRFVLLCHTDTHGDHFDLMIEEGPHLATWKLSQPPPAHQLPIKGRRIFDHRLAFLDYEGPLSGDKGRVTRLDKGTCVVHIKTPEQWKITFSGGRLVGRFLLSRENTSDQEWSFRAC